MKNKLSTKLKEERELIAKSSYFWGQLIAYATIAIALFSFFTDNYYTERLDAYLYSVNMDWIAFIMIAVALVKLYGIYADNQLFRGVGIVLLTVIWGLITVVSYMFSFGIGYPNDDFILNTFILLACFRTSYQGVFKK